MEAQDQKQAQRRTRKRRQKREQEKQKRAAVCFRIMTLATVFLSLFLILQILPGPTDGGSHTIPAKNPYGPEDFITRDSYITCTAGPTRRGVDVSEYQGRIDWKQVREAGFDFAFIRIGYRGYSVGDIYPDDRAGENLAEARAAGLDVGAYFYSQAISTEEAAEEARWCLEFLQGTSLDLPLVYDWEYVSPSARTGGMVKSTLTACAQTFCDRVSLGGYQPMVYFNNHISRDLLDLKAIKQYPFWLAQYRDQMDYPYRVDFWQYTETGSVPGIEGNVDIDLMFIYE